jgi:DNA invertase Pin-like site-specific DNA recombinase
MNKRRNMEEDTIEELTLSLNKCILNVKTNGAIGYARVANKGREKELDAQNTAIKEYCNKHNIMLKEIISDVGSAYNNSKLSTYDIIENNENIVLIVTKPSIISRNIVNGVTILDMCIKKNIIIHIIEDNYICNNTENNKRFICDIYDMMIESKEMSIKQKNNNKIRKVSRHVPFGMMKTNNNITELPSNHIEQHTIDIIDMMYYGCNSTDFYKLFNSLHNSKDILSSDTFRDYKNKAYNDDDFKKGFTVGTIVGLLNDYNILNRDKKWTNSSVNNIVDTYLEPGIHETIVEMVV